MPKAIMQLLIDRPIRQEDWAREVTDRDGHAVASGEAGSKVRDAGPWEFAVQRIVEMQHLEDNWDGYGAEAPSRAVLESAIGLAYCYLDNGVDPPHRVAPGPAGEVVFEWQDPDGTYSEVEIDRPLHAEIMVIEPGKPPRHWTIPTE
jgi:hypothetical protein